MTSPTAIVRPIEPADQARWRQLFREYRAFYLLPESEEIVTRAWEWFMDPAHTSNALVAEVHGEIVGFAHHRPVVAPSLGVTARFLDDLFTDPAARGRGVGRALITKLREIAAAEGSGFVQWVTAEDNHQAQALYNTLATRTSWVTYEATPDA
ncbi:acetyltransferase (GNAT) family protein [Leucobacter luti]|uniref:Acetyltransferase (GNAT) family protein n=1 Tax=Leucobacter luti TaxID=340320 RepID=A0A4R6RZT4_9MICO|nr:GNAT family N-acetyltransferase [Leucobacter luti]MCW2287815.1 GNAT superfamily N-acetyltransferase [Leucobacter luti]TCK46022.1 acetyltransferase (GNAT) family protein [Leucobacter luti]TDP92444.1 acetyltransferase (GNAT) family protein [Leucobacter luti]